METFKLNNNQETRASVHRRSFPSLKRLCMQVTCCVVSMFAVLGAPLSPSFAADHLDGPAVMTDPAADITDVYAWMQDGDNLNLILNVFPLANQESRFSDGVQYVFHVDEVRSFGGEERNHQIICTFNIDQAITCRVDGVTVVDGVDASDTSGVTNPEGSFRVFAGLRNDPFYFDLNNFNVVRRTVRDAAPSLSFDEAGCPTLDAATQGVLVGALTGSGGLPEANSPPRDFFAPLNVLSIVVQVNRSLIGSGPLYAVSATTHRQ